VADVLLLFVAPNAHNDLYVCMNEDWVVPSALNGMVTCIYVCMYVYVCRFVDELGYDFIAMLHAQGLPAIVSVIQVDICVHIHTLECVY